VFYMMNVLEIVQDFFYSPLLAAARGTARTYDRIGTWSASQHHDDLNARLQQMYPHQLYPQTAPFIAAGAAGASSSNSNRPQRQLTGPLFNPNNSAIDVGWDGMGWGSADSLPFAHHCSGLYEVRASSTDTTDIHVCQP
jgi:hypothetical protein